MPDPIISQEETDRLAAEMQSNLTQGPYANELINRLNTQQGASVLPSAQNIIANEQGIGASIDQTTNPGGVSPQDFATIQQANAQYAAAPQIPVSPVTAVGNQGNASLMPTLNQPINVGTSSGSIIGSHGVYVDPGTVAPWGVMMEKQKQLQVAKQNQDIRTNANLKAQDLAKKAKDKAFKFDRPEIPLVDDPHFQGSLNKAGRSVMDKKMDQAKDIHGADWQVALKSDTRLGREFRAEMDGLNIIARNANLMTEKFGEIKEGLADKTTYYSPSVVKAYEDYEQAINAFEDGDTKVLGDMRQILSRIDGEMELNSYLSDKGILANVVASTSGSTGISDAGEFMKLRTSNKKSYDKNLKAMALNVRKAFGENSSYTDKDIMNALDGHFQNSYSSKSSLKGKTKGGGSGLKMSPEQVKFHEGDKKVPLTVNDEKGEHVRTRTYNSVSTMPLPQSKSGLKFEGIQSVHQNGTLEPLANIREVNPISFQVISYDDPEDNSKLAYKKVVTSEIKRMVPEMKDDGRGRGGMVPTGKMREITETIQIDAESSEDQLRENYGDDAYDAFNANEAKFISGGSESSGAKKLSKPERNVSKIGMKDRVANGKMKKGDYITEGGQTAIYNGTDWVMED
jgi:hypothetical protein